MGRAGVSTGGCLTPQLGTPPTAPGAPSNREPAPDSRGHWEAPWGPLFTPCHQFPLGDAGAPTLGWALTESR